MNRGHFKDLTEFFGYEIEATHVTFGASGVSLPAAYIFQIQLDVATAASTSSIGISNGNSRLKLLGLPSGAATRDVIFGGRFLHFSNGLFFDRQLGAGETHDVFATVYYRSDKSKGFSGT